MRQEYKWVKMKPSTYEKLDKIGVNLVQVRQTRNITFDDILSELIESYENNT